MAHSCYLLLIFLFVTPTLQSVRHGFPPELLHMNNEDEMVQIGRIVSNGNELNQFIRAKRNAQPAAAAAAAAANATTADDAIGASKSSSSVKSSDQKNIETMVSHFDLSARILCIFYILTITRFISVSKTKYIDTRNRFCFILLSSPS